jgi:hypothetical protein
MVLPPWYLQGRRHFLPECREWDHTTHRSTVVFRFILLGGSATRWGEGKVVPVRAMKAFVGRRVTNPLFLKVGVTWPLYAGEMTSLPTE